MTKEQSQTISWYKRYPEKFKKLTESELEALKESLGLYYEYLYNDKSYKTYCIKDNYKWFNYRELVKDITKQQPTNSLENSDKPRAKHKKDFWSKELYILDHKISIWYGYKNNIDPMVIGSISNLRWITAYENSKKGIKCVFE